MRGDADNEPSYVSSPPRLSISRHGNARRLLSVFRTQRVQSASLVFAALARCRDRKAESPLVGRQFHTFGGLFDKRGHRFGTAKHRRRGCP